MAINLDDLGQKTKDVASAAATKVKDTVDLLKINTAIAGEQRDIEKNCLAIGQWFISEYDGEIPEGVKDLVDAVNASKAKIAELEASKPVKPEEPADRAMEEDKPVGTACPICGKVSDSKFCPHCGAPMGE